MAQKIEIPADLTQEYVVPDGLSTDELRQLAQAAAEQGVALIDADTDEGYDQAAYLAKVVDALKGAAVSRETEDAERQRSRDELRNRFAPDGPEGDEDEDGGDTTEGDPAPTADAELVSVTAGATVPSLRSIAKRVGTPKVPDIRPKNGIMSLVAAADVPGFSNGQAITKEDLGKTWVARAKGLINHQGDGRIQSGFASVVLHADPALTASATDDDITKVLKYAVDERRLPGDSLVAAAGWCAPSETLYDLLNVSTRDGILSLPEITVSRGGVKYSLGPDFGGVYGQGVTSLSESQVIGGTTKSSYTVPCPTWADHRMGVDVLFLLSEILYDTAYPEGISDFMEKALIAFDHQTSYNTIVDMVAGSQAVDMTTATTAPNQDIGAVATILGALELQAMDMKYRGRLAETGSLEVVLPMFARGIMRSDFTKRQGLSPEEITVVDDTIDALFRARGMNPQYVYDWQDNISQGGTANPFGSETAASFATTWPQTFKALLYPAGTWARALSPVISLSAVYDSTLLASNKNVGLFQERGRLTLLRGFDSRVVTLRSNPSGLTSGFVAQTHPAGATFF